jgi:NAD(P)-dependent dehydrogenase (short-subunit alcohol dehydrogenase family)
VSAALSTGDVGRRVALVTGAGGLLGSAFCAGYAAQYDIVAVCRRRRPDAVSQFEAYVDPLDPGGDVPENAAAVFVVYADLEKDADIERVIEITLARYNRIDLLVNNAAHMGIHPSGLIDGDASLDDVERTFATNVAAPLRLSVRVAQQFWRDRDLENAAHNRNIVNVSSMSGSNVYPHQGQAVYAASKAALNHLTRHLAAEFATFNVRVNALAPDSFPARVRTEAVAAAIVRLDESDATGRVLVLEDNQAAQASPAG